MDLHHEARDEEGYDQILSNKPKTCAGAPAMDRRSDHRPIFYVKDGRASDITETVPRKLRPMFGWRPSVSAARSARRLAPAWAEWTPATIGDVQREVQRVASVEAEWIEREGPQLRLGASAQERRLCELHQKLESQRSAAAAIGAGNGGDAAKVGRAVWRVRKMIRDCMTARRGAARGQRATNAACELGGLRDGEGRWGGES